MKILIFLFLVIAFTFQGVFSQDSTDNDGLISLAPEVKPWGRMKFMIIGEDNNIGVVDAGSRIGLRLNQKINNNCKIFGEIELGVNLGGTEGFGLSPNNSSSTGFLNVVSYSVGNLFNLRKGFLGIDICEFGKFSLGKQYGAYYDVAGTTDISENNSGYASYVFAPTGTDGGFSGTGRMSNSIVYRNTVSNFDFALSAQFRLDESQFVNLVNSFGGSVIYKTPFNLNIGLAFDKMLLNPSVVPHIRGLNDDPVYYALGINYESEKLFLGLTFANQTYGDVTEINDSTIIYSGFGIELASSWSPTKKISLLLGVNYKQPNNVDISVNKDFKLLIFFYGFRYQIFKNTSVYFEGAINRSIDNLGNRLPSNISFGSTLFF